jgi:hypothetical protein
LVASVAWLLATVVAKRDVAFDPGRAYTAIALGVGLSHERSDIAGAEGFYSPAGNMCGAAMRGADAQRDRIGSWEVSCPAAVKPANKVAHPAAEQSAVGAAAAEPGAPPFGTERTIAASMAAAWRITIARYIRAV